MNRDEIQTVQGREIHNGISVIVITHNEEKNIRDCLDSLLLLDYPENEFEILVVDSSTDSTPDIVQEYEKVKLIKSLKGFSQQRNLGLNAATYDICAFTDADCLVPPNWLKVINQSFRDDRIMAIGGNAYPPPGTGFLGLCTACVGHPAGGAVGFDANVTRSPEGVSFVAGCNCAFRRKVLQEVGGFDLSFFDGGEDVDISHRIRHRGHFIDYIPELTVLHKARGNICDFIKWNLNVGITKFNLKRPSLLKLIFQPSFPVWSFLLLLTLIYLMKFPLILIVTLAFGWISYIMILYIGAKPYPLLVRRRKKIGIGILPVLSIIPFLIYIRQVCINLGQIKKWHLIHRNAN